MKLKGLEGEVDFSSVQALARAVLGREVVRELASLLGEQGIPIMPLKGILLQQVLYSDPTERRISDVDVLVPEELFAVAVIVLCRSGYQPVNVARSLIAIAFRAPNGMTVDLHRQLFVPYRYKLKTAGLFERATRNESLFGVPVSLLDPLDILAHLVGKWVSDHIPGRHPERLRDLLRLVAHFEISPQLAAKHLDLHGLARAARYVLTKIASESEPFFGETLSCLPSDPVGRLCSDLVGKLLPWYKRAAIGALPAHLLNSSIPFAGLSVGEAGGRRLLHRYLHWGRGPAPAYLRLCTGSIKDSEK